MLKKRHDKREGDSCVLGYATCVYFFCGVYVLFGKSILQKIVVLVFIGMLIVTRMALIFCIIVFT